MSRIPGKTAAGFSLSVVSRILPPERILRQRLGRSWRSPRQPRSHPPLVVSHRDNNTQRIAALDERAEALN